MSDFHPYESVSGEWTYVKTAESRLGELRKLYEDHDYLAVSRGCDDLLKEYPTNHSARKLKAMAKRRLRGLDMRLAVSALSLALMVSVGTMSFVGKQVSNELQSKDFQVNSLIEEVGELRQENQWLFEKLNQNAVVLGDLEEEVEGSQSESVFDLRRELDEREQRLVLQSEAISELVDSGFSTDPVEIVAAGDTFDVLVLGTHGALTDTIMLASVNPALQQISLISIPRDLAVNGRRINEYYNRYGIDGLRDQVKEITGIYPEKYAVVDMDVFVEIVDAVGGVEVTVATDLYDAYYPGAGLSYQPFSIDAGTHVLDGQTALKYARSRKSTSDFDRAARQQQIIGAIRNQIRRMEPVKDLDKLIGIYSSVRDSVETNVEMVEFLGYVKKYQNFKIEGGNVLSSRNLLYSTTGPTGAYLLLPEDETYRAIWEWVGELV